MRVCELNYSFYESEGLLNVYRRRKETIYAQGIFEEGQIFGDWD